MVIIMLSTKKERLDYAHKLAAVALEHNASATISPSIWNPRSIAVTIKLDNYTAHIELDGRYNDITANWVAREDARFPTCFGSVVGSLNTYHLRKATTFENTPQRFLKKIAAGLKELSSHLASEN